MLFKPVEALRFNHKSVTTPGILLTDHWGPGRVEITAPQCLTKEKKEKQQT